MQCDIRWGKKGGGNKKNKKETINRSRGQMDFACLHHREMIPRLWHWGLVLYVVSFRHGLESPGLLQSKWQRLFSTLQASRSSPWVGGICVS